MPDLHGLTIGDLRVVRAVAEAGSISAAASALGYSQSGVSRRIAAVERAAGTTLFVRLPRGVQLTPTGARFHAHALRMMQAAVLAERDLADATDATRRLRVGSFSTANARLLPAALKRLSLTEPDLEVTVREHRSTTLIRWVTAGTVEAAVVSDYPSGTLRTDGVLLEHLADDPLVVALAPSHPSATARRLALHHLADEPWIEGDPSETTVLRAAAQRAGFEPRIAHRVRDWNAKLAFVAAGLGAAIVPGLAATSSRSDVTLRSLPDDLPTRALYLATTAASRTLPTVEQFRATTRAVLHDLRVGSGETHAPLRYGDASQRPAIAKPGPRT
jgi:DNA-binding transcriptional LysR family regulator